jgi:hypothetical protein
VAVGLAYATDADIEEALEFQHSYKGNLGDIMIALKYITETQRSEVLHLQSQGY